MIMDPDESPIEHLRNRAREELQARHPGAKIMMDSILPDSILPDTSTPGFFNLVTVEETLPDGQSSMTYYGGRGANDLEVMVSLLMNIRKRTLKSTPTPGEKLLLDAFKVQVLEHWTEIDPHSLLHKEDIAMGFFLGMYCTPKEAHRLSLFALLMTLKK